MDKWQPAQSSGLSASTAVTSTEFIPVALSTQSSRSNLAKQLQIVDSKEFFEQFDTDESGGISKEEWIAFLGKQADSLPSWEELLSRFMREKGSDEIDFASFESIVPEIRKILHAEVAEGTISPKDRIQRADSCGLDKYIASLHQALSRGDSMNLRSMDDLAESHPEAQTKPLSKDELHKQRLMKKFLSQIERVVDDSNKLRVKNQLSQLGLDDNLPNDIAIIYKSYRLTQMRFLHFAVYWCKSLSNSTEPLKFLLEQKSDVHGEAAYQGFGKARCTVRPIHLAAANPRGGIEELELLLKYKADVNARVIHNGDPHSTPLLDAAFMNEADAQGEKIVYLLDQKADPNLADKKTCQALHLVAQQGSDPELLIKVVPAMVRGGANLGAKIEATEDNKKFNKQLVGKTPLQIAADLQSSPSFPKDMLYLLAQSSWDSESAHKKSETDLFEEVRMIATVNRNAASQFTQCIKNKTNPNHSTALRKLRVEALAKSGHAIKKLSEIFSLAPLAGADILDMLVDTPLVEVKQQHPLPTCIDLGWLWFKVPMRCAYRDDEKDGKPAWLFANRGAGEWPEWHNRFKQEQMGRDSVYNVQTRVLWLPNALNIKLFTALSGQGSRNIEVFGQLAISGMIACVWDNLVWMVYCWRMMTEILIILALICWNARFLSSGMWILLLSSLGFEGIGLLCQTRACFDLGLLGPIFARACFKLGLRAPDTPDTSDIPGTPGTPKTPGTQDKSGTPFLISKMEVGATLVLIPLVIIRPVTGVDWAETELHDRICDMLLSFNVAFRFLKLVYGLRAFQETGRTILSIQQSLIARNVRQMLVVAFMFFVGSLLLFVAVRGPERFSQVVLAVFRVMVLTDQEGLSTLTSLQGGDTHGVYTGVMGYAITPFYTICLLTLVTAVYSNEYANIDPRASLLFEKSRAKICAQFMLQAHGLNSILPRKRLHSIQAAGTILVLCSGVLFLLQDENIWTCLLGVIIAACLVYMKLSWNFGLVQTRWDIAGVTSTTIGEDGSAGEQTKSRFLWICHREDFDPTNWRDNESAKEKQIEEVQGRLNKLLQETQTIRHTTKAQMDKIELNLKQVLENQNRMSKLCEKLEKAAEEGQTMASEENLTEAMKSTKDMMQEMLKEMKETKTPLGDIEKVVKSSVEEAEQNKKVCPADVPHAQAPTKTRWSSDAKVFGGFMLQYRHAETDVFEDLSSKEFVARIVSLPEDQIPHPEEFILVSEIFEVGVHSSKAGLFRILLPIGHVEEWDQTSFPKDFNAKFKDNLSLMKRHSYLLHQIDGQDQWCPVNAEFRTVEGTLQCVADVPFLCHVVAAVPSFLWSKLAGALNLLGRRINNIRYLARYTNEGHHELDLAFGAEAHDDWTLVTPSKMLIVGVHYRFFFKSEGREEVAPFEVDLGCPHHRLCNLPDLPDRFVNLWAERIAPRWQAEICLLRLAARPATASAPLPARQPVADDNPHRSIEPEKWCVTSAQLRDLLEEVRNQFPNSDPDVYKVVSDVIRPITEAQNVSYALTLNPDGLMVQHFISHSWAEGFKQFCHEILELDLQGGLWICFLANPQTWSTQQLAGLLGYGAFLSPFAIAIQHTQSLIVVGTERQNVYSRLWCVFELFLARRSGKQIQVVGKLPAFDNRRIRDGVGTTARCSKDCDTEVLRRSMRGADDLVDSWVRDAMQSFP